MTVCFVLVFPGVSYGLSGGRVYEMVTPVYKAGYGATLTAVSPNGESLVYNSLGAFAGDPLASAGDDYLARRDAGAGWTTSAIQPPFETDIGDFTPGLELAFAFVKIGDEEYEFVLYDTASPDVFGAWEPFMPSPFSSVVGQETASGGFNQSLVIGGDSRDLCHSVLVGGRVKGFAQVPFHVSEIYDLFRGCGGMAPYLRLVAVDNSLVGGEYGLLNDCGAMVGSLANVFDAVSGDGSTVFFSAATDNACVGGEQLFVRLDGSKTVEVSRPLSGVCAEVPCAGAASRPAASFRGASEDGSIAYFTTTAGLTVGDTDGKSDLYMARIGCPSAETACEPGERTVTSLVRVSEDPTPGGSAEVLGVVNVAPASGIVYFVAHGALTSVANGEGERPVIGADNLYGYDPASGRLVFVADLCSAPRLSGEHEDANCPPTMQGSDEALWTGNPAQDQLTDDGRFLVLSTFARLVRKGPGVDTDEKRDVYRYDIATGALERVSLGEEGFDANGNEAFEASIEFSGYGGGSGHVVHEEHALATRAVSNDGSWIVFSTAEPLSASVSNGQPNVYAWHEPPGETGQGTVTLVSSGSATSANEPKPTIAPSTIPEGRDIFFMTNAGLTPTDTENDLDIYDARINGGFPLPPTEQEQCSTDACQGPLTLPAPQLIPPSITETPEGNQPPKHKPSPKKKPTTHKKPKHKPKHPTPHNTHHQGGNRP